MNRNLAIRRLWWKELRQLTPLVGLLVLMGVLLQVLAVLLPFGARLPWREAAAILGMPGLFAAGVGALLIGQEKEARTLDWLRSLPLVAGDLVRTKLLVALLGLLVVWSVSLTLGWVTGAWEAIRDGHGSELLWPLHSVFLLLIGFATAWRCRSSMIALLLVVPLAGLPLLLAGLHQSVLEWRGGGWRFWTGEPTAGLMAIYLTIFAAGFAWYGWRAGLAYLAPHAAPRHQAQAQAAGKASSPSALGYRSIAPAPALLWQFIAQNRGVLSGLVLLQLLSLLLPLPWAIIGCCLAISWFGASVFQGDVLQRRVLFLAERGVSPPLVWWTRQIVPLGLVLLGLLFFWTVGLPWELNSRQLLDPTAMTLVAALMLCIYLSSQWLGQIATSPIVAAIAAPLVALATAAYFVYCSVELEASWWSVAGALLVPLVATGWGVRDWMDRRSAGRMWSKHVGLVILYLLLPLSSFLVAWASAPGMSPASRKQLQAILVQPERHDSHPRELTIAIERSQFAPPDDRAQMIQESIRQQLAQHSGAIKASSAHLTCITEAMRLRLIDRDPGEEATREEITSKYRVWLALLIDLHDRLRMSWRLIEQDQADAIEMWLVEELKADGAQQRLGSNLLERLQRMFSNTDERLAARSHALALSWLQSEDRQLGGYQMNVDNGGYVTTKDVWEASRQADVISELLLQSLQAEGSRLVSLRGQIGELMGYPVAPKRQMYIENADGERQLLYFETVYSYVPGAYWNGDWEREGAALSRFAPRD